MSDFNRQTATSITVVLHSFTNPHMPKPGWQRDHRIHNPKITRSKLDDNQTVPCKPQIKELDPIS